MHFVGERFNDDLRVNTDFNLRVKNCCSFWWFTAKQTQTIEIFSRTIVFGRGLSCMNIVIVLLYEHLSQGNVRFSEYRVTSSPTMAIPPYCTHRLVGCLSLILIGCLTTIYPVYLLIQSFVMTRIILCVVIRSRWHIIYAVWRSSLLPNICSTDSGKSQNPAVRSIFFHLGTYFLELPHFQVVRLEFVGTMYSATMYMCIHIFYYLAHEVAGHFEI